MKKFAKKTISHSGSVEAYCGACGCTCDAACGCTDVYRVVAFSLSLQLGAVPVADNRQWRIESGK